MSKPRVPIREAIRQALVANLEPGEQLRWFSTVKQLKGLALLRFLLSWSILLPLFGPLIAANLIRYWYVGITQDRVLFGEMMYAARIDSTKVIAVPLADVTVGRRGRRGGELFVANPPSGMPAKFRLINAQNLAELEALLRPEKGQLQEPPKAQPTTTSAAPPAVAMSPDGSHWWDGTAWVDCTEAAPGWAARSPDGAFWWDGVRWRAVPGPVAGHAESASAA